MGFFTVIGVITVCFVVFLVLRWMATMGRNAIHRFERLPIGVKLVIEEMGLKLKVQKLIARPEYDGLDSADQLRAQGAYTRFVRDLPTHVPELRAFVDDSLNAPQESRMEASAQSTATGTPSSDYRKWMDAILKKRQIVPENERGKPDFEVISVASYIVRESLSRASRDSKKLNDDEAYVAALYAMVAANHLSRLGHVSFEASSAAVCLDVLGDRGLASLPETIQLYNSMATSPREARVLEAIGNQVALFFMSNDDQYLDELGERFGTLVSSVKPR